MEVLNEHKLNRLEERYQSVKIIEHFNCQRPETLLYFSKVFLNLANSNAVNSIGQVDLEQECLNINK